MNLLFFLLFGLLSPNYEDFDLKDGDLIFQESCSGTTGNAIKEVTTSAHDYQFTHVGIICYRNDSVFVLEATHPKVQLTYIDHYLRPETEDACYPKSVAGRLKPEYRHLIPSALGHGLSLIGLEYDYGYILNNDKYYCSELIYDIFLKANNNIPVFPLNVMTFKASHSDSFSKNWIDYFDKLDMPVPEGQPGINPDAMSRSQVIEIIHHY